jgi:hypothetical protein
MEASAYRVLFLPSDRQIMTTKLERTRSLTWAPNHRDMVLPTFTQFEL